MQIVEPATLNFNRRVRPGLLPLQPLPSSIPIIACRTDKLEIAVAGAISFYNLEQLESCLYNFSGESSSRPSADRVLNALRGTNRGQLGRIQPIRQENWLFSGQLRHGRTHEGQRTVTLQLSINPTRFAEHCFRRFAPISLNDLNPILPRTLLRRDRTIAGMISALTLDGSDNYISSTPWMTYISRNWSQLVVLYTTRVCELVEYDFNSRSAEAEGVDAPVLRLQRPSDTAPSFGYVEQHVEFEVDNAAQAYRLMERRLRAASSTYFQNDLTGSGREANARWVSCAITKYITAKLYAKSLSRIRLELEYHGPSSGSNRSMDQIVRRELWNGRTRYTDRLDAIRRDALERISYMLDALGPWGDDGAVDQVLTFSELISAFCSVRARPSEITEFLQVLFNEGSVEGSTHIAMRRIAEQLYHKQFLRPMSLTARTGRKRYVPSERLRQLIGMIAGSNE